MSQPREEALMRTVGRNVRSARLKAGLTQEEAASRSEIDVKHLQKIETGSINVTLRSLARLAFALRTTPELLLRDR